MMEPEMNCKPTVWFNDNEVFESEYSELPIYIQFSPDKQSYVKLLSFGKSPVACEKASNLTNQLKGN